ncbi:MAG: helix-turn-helix transcriptional regulator [Acholeplasmataceae bacterium]|nr:helix-turn-helix transcriptional regulator [Acholeplasmataceae bacterium]
MNYKMKAARAALGLSQLDLALKIGVSRQTILLIEKNEFNPSLGICKAICIALNCSLNDLFWEETKNEK